MTVSDRDVRPAGVLGRAIFYSLMAAVCMASAAILAESEKYGAVAVGFQLVLAFLWSMAASAKWRRFAQARRERD